MKPGLPLSRTLRDALGMASSSVPPPWLINMQRYGPPPSWPGLAIPGLNAPLPNADCQYGFHPGGWGKPPIDAYGRPLYGGNPFDPPGSKYRSHILDPANLVTSDGKAAKKVDWGALPNVYSIEIEEDEPESSDEDMEASSDEEDQETPSEEAQTEAFEAALGIPTVAESSIPTETSSTDNEDNQFGQVKNLYQVIEQRQAVADDGALFASQVKYVVNPSETVDVQPALQTGVGTTAPASKAMKKKEEDDEDDYLIKGFKF
jgi:splicing factor 3B subunit 2